MASSSSGELVGFASPSQLQSRPSYFPAARDLYSRFSQWRTSLALPNPGTVENMQKEVKNTHLTNFFFDGARADLTKVLSMNPVFHVTHSFALASQNSLPSYNFGAVFANSGVFMQGGVDHEGHLNCRFNRGWTANNVTKFNAQISRQASLDMLQLEHDYQGQDYSLNMKAINPSAVDFSGIYIANYLQSVTKNLALGGETLFQRLSSDTESLNSSYLLKYTGSNKDWIASAQLQPAGILQTTYWQKLSEKVDVAADLQIVMAPGKRDGIATLGAKYDLRMSTFRAQLDSTGKVSALLEQRFAPTFSFLVSGEIDHFRNAAKIGVGVMIESSSLSPEEMGMPPY